MNLLSSSLPALLLAGIACAPAAPPTRSSWTPAPAPGVTVVEPARSPAECASLVARVTAYPDSFHATSPLLRKFAVPPIDPIPRGQAGETIRIRVVVDPSGTVMADSIAFAPEIIDRDYRKRLLHSVAEFSYHPAVLDGCAVPGVAMTLVTLPRRVRL